MISEGRLVYILGLMNDAHKKLEESWDIDDQDVWIETIGEAKDLLEHAILHSRLLDKPLEYSEVEDPDKHIKM